MNNWKPESQLDKLIAAMVCEVRIRDGATSCGPIDAGLAGNLELRIKGYLAAKLGVCKPESVLSDNSLALIRSKGGRFCKAS